LTLSSTNVIPELQYWFESFVRTSDLNKHLTMIPSTLPSSYLDPDMSFIRLLFDNSWPTNYTSYRYLYRQETNVLSIPYVIRNRMMVYPSSAKYYVCDNDSTAICSINIFNLRNDDIRLLDRLLSYRLDTTGTTIIDINYNSLSTNLSKLIYCYLDLKINKNYSRFDSTTPISSSTSLLENCYEMYVAESVFDYLKYLNKT